MTNATAQNAVAAIDIIRGRQKYTDPFYLNSKMTKQEIYPAYQKEIYFFLLRKMHNSAEAKNILQTTFLKALENYTQIRDKKKMKSWLFQIARNEMIDYYKNASRYVSLSEDTREKSYSEPLDLSEQFCCLNLFINRLPNIYKEPVQLIYKEGKSQVETAEILGLKLTTIKGRIRKAKHILIKDFEECCQYRINADGKLAGEQNCIKCNEIR